MNYRALTTPLKIRNADAPVESGPELDIQTQVSPFGLFCEYDVINRHSKNVAASGFLTIDLAKRYIGIYNQRQWREDDIVVHPLSKLPIRPVSRSKQFSLK